MMIYFAMLETDEDRQSFGEYYREHYGKCLAVAYSITKNKTLAEEAVQNAFMRMIRNKEKYFFDIGKRTDKTIVIIVRSECINILKHEKRFTHSDLEEIETIVADNEPEAFRIIAGKEALSRLKLHVSQLDEFNQTLFEMKYQQDLSDGEIANIFGISKNAVALRIHKIRKGALEILREEGYIDG